MKMSAFADKLTRFVKTQFGPLADPDKAESFSLAKRLDGHCVNTAIALLIKYDGS